MNNPKNALKLKLYDKMISILSLCVKTLREIFKDITYKNDKHLTEREFGAEESKKPLASVHVRV